MDLLNESTNPKYEVNQILLCTQEVSTRRTFNMIFLVLLILVNYAVSNCMLADGLDALVAILDNKFQHKLHYCLCLFVIFG